jgi:hypothetical protein
MAMNTAETECRDRGNCRTPLFRDFKCLVANQVASGTVALTNGTLAYTAKTCTEACYRANAEFVNFKTAGAECLCYEGASSCDTGNKAAHAGSETWKIECPCYWSVPLTVQATTTCGVISGANAITADTATPLKALWTYTAENCHYQCQNSGSCQSFSFDTTSGAVCTLYDKACVASTFNSGSAVAASTNYAKVWFNEAPFTTIDTCTH